MRVTGVGPSSRYVKAAGTAASAQKAFSVKLAMFQRGAHVVRAPVGDARVPKGLKPAVLGVTGLDTAPHIMRHGDLGPPPGFVNGRPCSLFYGQVLADQQADFTTPLPKFQGAFRPYAHCGYTPLEFRAAYGVTDSGLTGKGATVAITDAYAAPTIRFDANHYATRHGDPAFTQSSLTQSLPSKPFHNVGCAAATAGSVRRRSTSRPCTPWRRARTSATTPPGRCIDNDFLESLQRVVDDNKASIVTNSWGDLDQNATSGNVAAYEQVFKQGAIQGIGFMFSSGDNGDELRTAAACRPTTRPPTRTSPRSAAPRPGSAPTASCCCRPAGAPRSTACPPTARAGSRRSRRRSCTAPAAGTRRCSTGRPTRTASSRATPGRAVPDVALDADPTTGHARRRDADVPERRPLRRVPDRRHEPRLAAVRGHAGAGSQAAGGRLGFVNPTIYAMAREQPGAFRDVRRRGGGNVRSDYVNGVESERRDPLQRPHVRPGLEPS